VNLSITGCQKQAVGATIRGTYTLHSENHGKPVYRRNEELGNGLQVFIYFWNEVHTPSETGWWIGSVVGGSDVWAYHPDSSSKSPPATDWRVPFDGIPDPTMRVETMSTAPPKPTAMNNASFAPKDKPPPAAAKEAPKSAENKPAAAAGSGKKEGVKDRLKHWLGGASGASGAMEEAAAAAADRIPEPVRLPQEDLWKRGPEERARLIKEQHEAAEASRRELSSDAAAAAMDRLRRATAADFETLAAELEHLVILQEEAGAGPKLRMDAENLIAQERDRVTTGGRETKRRESNTKRLVAELEALVEVLESKSNDCQTLADSMQELGEISHEKWESHSADIEEHANSTSTAHKSCCTFLATHRGSMEEATTIIVETRTQLKDLMVRAHQAIGKASGSIQSAENSLVAAVELTKKVQEAAASRKATEEHIQRVRNTLELYDKDGDGQLNLKELQAYTRGQFGLELSREAWDRVMAKLAHGEQPAATVKTFHHVSIAVGIEREFLRSQKVQCYTEQRRMLFEERCEIWLREVTRVAAEVEEVGQKVSAVVTEVKSLGDHLRGAHPVDLVEVIKHSDAVAGKLCSVQAELADVSIKVDDVCAYRNDPQLAELCDEMQITEWPELVYQLVERPGMFASSLCQAEALRMELEAVVGAQRAALQRVEQEKQAFTKYDDAGDGVLSKDKIAAYAKGEFNFEVVGEALDRIYNKLHISGDPGVSLRTLHLLKVAVGVERESQRDAQRILQRELRGMRFEEFRRDWWQEAAKVAKSIEGLQKKTDFVAEEVESLRDQSDDAPLEERLKNADEAGTVLKYLEAEVGTVCKRLYEMGIEQQPADFQDMMQSEAKQIQLLTAESNKLSEVLEEMTAGYALAKGQLEAEQPVVQLPKAPSFMDEYPEAMMASLSGAAVDIDASISILTASSGRAASNGQRSQPVKSSAPLSAAVTRPWMRKPAVPQVHMPSGKREADDTGLAADGSVVRPAKVIRQ